MERHRRLGRHEHFKRRRSHRCRKRNRFHSHHKSGCQRRSRKGCNQDVGDLFQSDDQARHKYRRPLQKGRRNRQPYGNRRTRRLSLHRLGKNGRRRLCKQRRNFNRLYRVHDKRDDRVQLRVALRNFGNLEIGRHKTLARMLLRH